LRFVDGNEVALWLSVLFAVLGAIVSGLRLRDMPQPDE
jgi:hypothetical protein